ncbi:hypothetical protein FGRMN_10680 [Fusarium graminum]|nr:hypothetical protein FGRMN_10680 [Fusarium graminum]
MKPLLESTPIVPSQANLQYAEPHVVDFKLLKEGPGGSRSHELFDVLRAASPTGLLHLVNHGLDPNLFQTLRAVTYAYMTTTSQEEKDQAETVQGTGSFEGYKPRTTEE